jgi:hypothetical protein
VRELTAIADRGYFKGEEILAGEATGVPRSFEGSRPSGRSGSPEPSPHENAASKLIPGFGLLAHRLLNNAFSRSLDRRLPPCLRKS